MKFFNLLKKELSELLTGQTLLSMVVIVAMFVLLGNVMNTSVEQAMKQEYSVTISDRDNTDLTAKLMEDLRSSGATVNEFTTSGDDYSAIISDIGKDSIVIIPEGFTEAIDKGEKPELLSISSMRSASALSNISNDNSGAVGLIQRCISNMLSKKAGLTEEDIALINAPMTVSEQTVISDKSANISASSVMSKLMMQNMLLPVIVFILIIMTSQTIMSSISNEKIDKTLETLLSAPVSRTAILCSKTLAAAIVALLNAAVYMVSFSGVMKNATNSVTSELGNTLAAEYMSVDEAMEKLGLILNAGDYILIGIQLFLTIMICLSISLMLGALISDSKQAQTMIMPLMFMAMIPYLISMVADINGLPMAARIAVYAIPFTHTFSAIPNLMFGHTGIFFIGLAYQAVVFVICLMLALKLFNSDKILTISLNFGQKSKFKKNSSNNE